MNKDKTMDIKDKPDNVELRDWFAIHAPEMNHRFYWTFRFWEEEPATEIVEPVCMIKLRKYPNYMPSDKEIVKISDYRYKACKTNLEYSRWYARRELAMKATWQYQYADMMMKVR